jgi:CHAT domain-containing protein
LRNDRDLSSNNYILAVGDPIFADANKYLRPLPDADEEAHNVALQFRRRDLITGHEATAENVLEALPEAQIFHFAGHSLTEGREPGLLLASGPTALPVLLGEAQLRPQTMPNLKLAVLSACNTAAFDQGPNDPQNLLRLFFRAGVPHVIASKWPIDSAVSSNLMERFYGRLLAGDRVDLALAAAERGVRSRPETSHPYYWAAFSTFGGG